MYTNERLIEFFRSEIDVEQASGWPRLNRIPDTHVMASLRSLNSLSTSDQQSSLDCLAGMACVVYGHVLDLPLHDHTQHPFFRQWGATYMRFFGEAMVHSVPMLRVTVAQFKIDVAKGKKSHITQQQFDHALSVRGMKAPELRKGVKEALKALGLQRVEKVGGGDYVYHCQNAESHFRVWIDYGGRNAQLRYHVALPEFETHTYRNCFSFESALGFGHGDWDSITEANFEDSMRLLCEVVEYSAALPARMKAFCG